jgi:Protein of unknown function (DUF2793)
MNTPRFDLPLLATAQAHKEITHNEALLLIDFLLHPVVEAFLNVPPSNLAMLDAGKCWIVSDGATGAWQGHVDKIACWTGDDWRYLPPMNGMKLFDADTQKFRVFISNQWLVPQAITGPSGGISVDAEARTAISALLDFLRQNGTIAT